MNDEGDYAKPHHERRYLHLAPRAVWEAQLGRADYRPESFDADGFIHLTIGDDNVVEVGNRYYVGDPREQVVLEIDPALLSTPVRFEDADRIYPHLHGPLNLEAVVAVRRVRRGADGTFLAVEVERLEVTTRPG